MEISGPGLDTARRHRPPQRVRVTEISPEGEAIYSMGPEAFAQHMCTLVSAGAALVGGCCGTDPRYISALRDVLPR